MSGVESTEIEKYFAQITSSDILSFTFLAIIEIISSAIVCDKYDVCCNDQSYITMAKLCFYISSLLRPLIYKNNKLRLPRPRHAHLKRK